VSRDQLYDIDAESNLVLSNQKAAIIGFIVLGVALVYGACLFCQRKIGEETKGEIRKDTAKDMKVMTSTASVKIGGKQFSPL
jgi:hypothetical protein